MTPRDRLALHLVRHPDQAAILERILTDLTPATRRLITDAASQRSRESAALAEIARVVSGATQP